MRFKRVKIDSLNLSSPHMETIFIYNNNYQIELVKTKGKFNPKRWSETFGKALKRNIIEAKIIHTHLGLDLPLKTFSVTPKSQTLEFAGLHGYNERSQDMIRIFSELRSQLIDARVMRVDIAIDYNGKVPQAVIKALSKHREPFRFGNTTYYKTPKEKKTNQKMDIKIYNKAHKDKLSRPLYRLEFVFKGNYFNKLRLNDLDLLLVKMQKSVKKATGLNIKIDPVDLIG